MAKSKSKSRSYKKKNLKRGGNNASDWVKQVVGDYPHNSQGGVGNVIQQHVPAINMTGGFSGSDILNPGNSAYEPIEGAPSAYKIPVTTPGAAPMSGGRKRKGSKKMYCKRKGGDLISEIAVPAVLLVANQTFRNKKDLLEEIKVEDILDVVVKRIIPNYICRKKILKNMSRNGF